MKNYRKILIIFIGLLIFIYTGCEKQFLDKEPRTAFSEKDIWGDIEQTKKYVWNNYNALGHWGITEVIGRGGRIMEASVCDESLWMFDYGTWDFMRGQITESNLGVFSGRGVSGIGIWSDNYQKGDKESVLFIKANDLPRESEAE